MTTITNEAREATDKLFGLIGRINNTTDISRPFNLAPRVEQSFERTVMQTNAFLSQINNYGVREVKSSILGMEVPKTITKRTRTPNAARNGSLRRPTDPTSMKQRSYELFEVEQDTVITWDKIDTWANLPNFYERYREMVTFASGRDRLLIMWHGQTEAEDTDPDTHMNLQDVNKGFFQFMMDEHPDNVLGWDKVNKVVVPIKIDPTAPDADFRTINQLVYAMRYDSMHRLFQNRNDLRVLIGDELTIAENIDLLGQEDALTPTERAAVEKYLPKSVYGETPRIRSDEFPRRGIFLTAPRNLSRYYQKGSTRRKVKEDDHEHKGIVDYNYTREDYVLEAAEGAACVHPDAILMKDAEGSWAPASEVWKIVASVA